MRALLTAAVLMLAASTVAADDMCSNGYNGIQESRHNGSAFTQTGQITMSSGDLVMTGHANAPMIENAASSTTNPTLIPDRAQPGTGVGRGGTNALSLISNGAEALQINASQVLANSSWDLVARGGIKSDVGDTTIEDNLAVEGFAGATFTALTLDGSTALPVTRSFHSVACTGAETITTITGRSGTPCIDLLFLDANCTVTDTAAATTDTVNLSAAFTSTADDMLRLCHNGTKWYEADRSVN